MSRDAELEAEVRAARSLCKDALMGQLPIEALVQEVRDLWEFDTLIYRYLPDDAQDLASMCWVYGDEEYERNGGDDRLNRAIAVMAAGGE
jgi:hypothetical protein